MEYFFTEGDIGHMLLGYGIGTGQHYIGRASHSTPLDFLWGMGIVGFLAYIVFYISVVKYCVRSKSKVALACIIAIEIWSLFLSLSNQIMYWTYIYYCVAVARNSYRENMLT